MSVIHRSNNPFLDFGLPYSEELIEKHEAIMQLIEVLGQIHLSEVEVAKLAAMDPEQLSDMLSFKLSSITLTDIRKVSEICQLVCGDPKISTVR